MIDILKSEIYFLKSSWQNMLGRPLIVIAIKSMHLGTGHQVNSKALLEWKQLQYLLIIYKFACVLFQKKTSNLQRDVE